MTVVNDVPDEVARLFHAAKAKPVLREAYRASSGWQPVARAPLTTDLCISLYNDGFTRVRARWRFTTRDITLKPLVEKHIGPRRSTWQP
ncbi:hypothetical protein GCM10027416_08310 [Okibacterium endophyticum]